LLSLSLTSLCELFIAFRFFISFNLTITCVDYIFSFAFCQFIDASIVNAFDELNTICILLFNDVDDFCWLQNKLFIFFVAAVLLTEFSYSQLTLRVSSLTFWVLFLSCRSCWYSNRSLLSAKMLSTRVKCAWAHSISMLLARV